MKIDTKRLTLRNWKLRDVEAFVKITKQKEVIKWIANVKYNTSVKEARKLIESDEENKTDIYFAIVEKESEEVFGSVWLRNVNDEDGRKLAELGILLRKEFWNKGYATEACKAVIGFGFRKLKLVKIYGKVNEENKSSKKMVEKLGFKLEGRLRKEVKTRFQNKKCNDYLYYGLLKEEFK